VAPYSTRVRMRYRIAIGTTLSVGLGETLSSHSSASQWRPFGVDGACAKTKSASGYTFGGTGVGPCPGRSALVC
jgi:hypothetical protein